MATGLINTLPRSSCGKCVSVLKELISGLDDQQCYTENVGSSTKTSEGYEPPPLTLLRAIARSSREHPLHDQWGQERKNAREIHSHHRLGHHRQNNNFNQTQTRQSSGDNSSSIAYSIARVVANATKPTTDDEQQQHQQEEQHRPMLYIEEREDGVRLTIPVETTVPALMTKWTHLEQPRISEAEDDEEDDEEHDDSSIEDGKEGLKNKDDEALDDWIPLATSVRRDEDNESNTVTNPLMIELKCRRCETSGPEAGARAFLMGPEPLSIVLCHNRIDSDRAEVEEILTHELIHLYDVQTLKLDLSDCETVAYSEVRAAREAECHRSVFAAANSVKENLNSHETSERGLVAMTNQISETLEKHVYKPYCVRGIALGATQNMFPSRGKSCLNKVWETAYGDNRPFARTSRSSNSKNGRITGETSHSTTKRNSNSPSSNDVNTTSGTFHGNSGK